MREEDALSGWRDSVPELGCAVVVACRQLVSVWRPGKRIGLIFRRQRGQVVASARIPELEQAIVACGCEPRAVRRPADSIDGEWVRRLMVTSARIPKPGAQLSASRRIPDRHPATTVSGGQLCAIGRPRRRKYRSATRSQCRAERQRRHGPYPHTAILVTLGE